MTRVTTRDYAWSGGLLQHRHREARPQPQQLRAQPARRDAYLGTSNTVAAWAHTVAAWAHTVAAWAHTVAAWAHTVAASRAAAVTRTASDGGVEPGGAPPAARCSASFNTACGARAAVKAPCDSMGRRPRAYVPGR